MWLLQVVVELRVFKSDTNLDNLRTVMMSIMMMIYVGPIAHYYYYDAKFKNEALLQ